MLRVGVVGVCLLSVALGSPVGAAERLILGKKLVVRDPSGSEANRVTVVVAKETATDVPGIVGDPTVDGATLRIMTTGTSAVDEFYALHFFGWTATSTGFVFRGAGGVPPIVRVLLKRSASGVALLKVVLRGNVGSRDLDVVPPNSGSSGVAVLSINNGGDRYCASYGGAAGGTVARDTATVFRVKNPTAQPPCPADPPQHCCDFGTSQQCAWAGDAEDCIAAGGNPGDGNSVCDSASGLCTAPPADEGNCCEGATTVFGTNCGAGPNVALFCADLGGTLFSSAVCTPAGDCASPSGAFVDSSPTPF